MRSNAQLGRQNTELVWHVDEIPSIGQRWHFTTLGYYIPKVTMSSWSTPIIGCYTSKLVLVLNPTATNLKLDRYQLLIQLE